LDSIHAFLVKDTEGWGEHHNKKTIQSLSSLLMTDDFSNIDILKEVVEKANTYMPYFMKDWHYELQFSEEQQAIIPVVPSDPEELEDEEDNNAKSRIIQEWQRKLKTEELMSLQPLVYTDIGVVSQSRFNLDGTVFDDQKSKFTIVINVPGINEERKTGKFIKLKNKKGNLTDFLIEFKIPQETPAPGYQLMHSTMKYGVGTFKHIFPAEKPFEAIKKNEFLEKRVTIKNGQVIITLDQEEDGSSSESD